MNICETFKYLANNVWHTIELSRRISFPIQEETLTDINMVNLKLHHPEVRTITFNKRKEGKNGADWEWWFSNGGRRWVGFRVQAKVMDIRTESFEQLYYQKDSSSVSQNYKLITSAKADPLNSCLPLYVLFLQNNTYPEPTVLRPHTVKEDYGCSIVSAYKVRDSKAAGRGISLREWQSDLIPWHELVCYTTGTSSDLIDHISKLSTEKFANAEQKANSSFITDTPPSYILKSLYNETVILESEENPHNLAGALIINVERGEQ